MPHGGDTPGAMVKPALRPDDRSIAYFQAVRYYAAAWIDSMKNR